MRNDYRLAGEGFRDSKSSRLLLHRLLRFGTLTFGRE
jgi:hypothetical protein